MTAVDWSTQVSDDLGGVCTPRQLDWLFNEWQAGRVHLWSIDAELRGDRHLATATTFIEEANDGELDMVVAFFHGPQLVLAVHYAYPELLALAKSYGATRARVHAARNGIERILKKYGFSVSELVLEKPLGGADE